MNLTPTTTDNVTEVLSMIIEFTQRRDKVLTSNIMNANKEDFVPEDLDVSIFADLMGQAISEHIRSRRLVLRDSETITFGENGRFESRPVEDRQARMLFEKDKEQYLEMQVHKLSENRINQRIAAELLRHCQEV